MKFNPIDYDKKETSSLQEGEAKYLVINSEECVSKSGNEMLKIKLKITQENNGSSHIYDYLVSADNCVWKISSFCKSSSNEGIYKEGSLTPEKIKGWEGLCILKKETSEDYGDQIKISHYIEEANKTNEQIKDDDLPF